MKKWTGRWLECRIHSFWSVHSKGPSWQLKQRPLQKNRSLTLTTVWGENVSGPEHCQNPPGAVCSYWSGMRERNWERKRGRKKEGLREKETSDLGFCLRLVMSEMGGAGREYICYQNAHWKGGRQRRIPKQSHMMTGAINFPFHPNGFPTQPQGFLKVFKFWSRHWFSEFTVRANLIREKKKKNLPAEKLLVF